MSALPHTVTPFPATPAQPVRAGQMTAEQAAQAALRARLRDFLRAIPEQEPDAVLELRFPDGSVRQVSRGQLTARIRWLRPRQRRIIERQIIGHVSRDQVGKELCVCRKTLERDQTEALDILLDEAHAAEV